MSFEIVLLGRSEEAHAASPSVIVLTSRRGIGLRMKSVFENHQHFKELNSGLVIEVPGQFRFRLPAGEASRPDLSSTGKGPYDALCAFLAFGTRLPPTEYLLWKKTTIGGVVYDPVREQYYALTVAHCFKFEKYYEALEDKTSGASGSDIQLDVLQNSLFSDQITNSSTEESCESPIKESHENGPFGMYLCSVQPKSLRNGPTWPIKSKQSRPQGGICAIQWTLRHKNRPVTSIRL